MSTGIVNVVEGAGPNITQKAVRGAHRAVTRSIQMSGA